MNEIQIFNSPEFGTIRTLETTDGKVLFCGADVAKALGYARPSEAVSKHCKGTSKQRILTNGGMQEMLFISEGDLYRLITHSKRPEAERFETWVFDEVLPTIRKHGTYTTAQPDYSALSPQLQFLIQMEQRQKELETAVRSTNQRIDDMRDVMQPVSDDWRPAMNKLVCRIAADAEYPISELYFDIYDEVDIRGGVHLDTRLEHLRERMWDRGASATYIDRLNKLDVIAQDKKLIAIY
ncbi:MAG: hypothetical protein K2G25_03725, partial [Oscillospiraceae bacterium]|nr:hypothetical protein [Oscillospiraceae bacterium]